MSFVSQKITVLNASRMIALGLILTVAACQTDNKDKVLTITGRVLGDNVWNDTTLFEGRVDLPFWNSALYEKTWVRRLPKSRDQYTSYKNGYVKYVRTYGGTWYYTLPHDGEFMKYVFDFLNKSGVDHIDQLSKRIQMKHGVKYVSASGRNGPCVAFIRLMGPPLELGRLGILDGGFCSEKTKERDAYTTRVLAFVKNIREKKAYISGRLTD